MKDKALRDEIAYEYRKWNPSASIGRALEFADSILSLIAPELEKAEKWRKVEEMDRTCDGCPFHVNYSCCYDEGCPFAAVTHILSEEVPDVEKG